MRFRFLLLSITLWGISPALTARLRIDLEFIHPNSLAVLFVKLWEATVGRAQDFARFARISRWASKDLSRFLRTAATWFPRRRWARTREKTPRRFMCLSMFVNSWRLSGATVSYSTVFRRVLSFATLTDTWWKRIRHWRECSGI